MIDTCEEKRAVRVFRITYNDIRYQIGRANFMGVLIFIYTAPFRQPR